jgi:hypothetical protein
MYQPPEEFVEKLQREFPGYRVRWSLKNCRWQLEMPVGRGALPGTYPEDKFDDGTVRAADGYWLILEVSPRPYTKCPECGFHFDLPELRIKEASCEYCCSRGLDAKWMLGYFPLGEALLNQLRKTDPKRDGIRKLAARVDAKNKARLDAIKRNADDQMEYSMREHRNEIFEIPQSGYRQPSSMWTNAPESPRLQK